jgi:uncharacterized membrane protein YfcA
MPSIWLTWLFAAVALLYAAVGFGGGSTYNALLVLADLDYQIIPSIALTCNIIVVSGGVYHFGRAGHFRWQLLMPYALLAVPMAWMGGRLPVSETVFVGLLGMTLLLTALHMLMHGMHRARAPGRVSVSPWPLGLPVGALIGFLSGVVGVGGGVFLAPFLYLFTTHSPRQIAALASGFILVNSIAGLSGQLMKRGALELESGWAEAWPLYLAVLLGGQLGSRLGALRLPEAWVRRLTGMLLLYVALRLIFRWTGLLAG